MPNNKKRPINSDDFYLLRNVFDVRLSPDGKRVAYTVSWPDKDSDETHMSVWVADLDSSAKPRRFTHGKHDHSARWSPDGHCLAFVSTRGDKNQIYLAPLDGGEARQLTKAKHGVAQPAWSPDGKRIAYAARTGEYKESKERKGAERAAPRVIRDLRYKLDGIGFFDARRMHIFTVDVESGAETQITDGDWHDEQPAWSPNGKLIAFSSDRERERHQRQWRNDIYVAPSKGGRSRKLTPSWGQSQAPVFSPDGRMISYAGHEQGDYAAGNAHLYVVSAAGGPARSLSAPLDRSTFAQPAGQSHAWARDGKAVFFIAGDRGMFSLYRAGVANGSVNKVLGGDRQIESFAVTPDGRQAVFTAAWATDPREVYAQSLDGKGRPRTISDANDALRDSVEFATLRRMSYHASDGWEIDAFVMYPPQYRKGRRYPLVLQIHGGPHGMHPNDFPISAEAMAAAGYVVLMPNPRGSTGYGEQFALACVRDWGGMDYEDLMAGVDALVRRGVADPERLFVGGYSYGGYMSSWVVGHTDRFRAAAIGAPVTNAVSMFGEGDIPHFDIFEMGGAPWDDPEEYRFRSPVTYLQNVKTPVLLLHWEGDLRCPIGQSEEVFQGLKVLGKKVEFIRYPGGSHGGRTPSQAVDQIKRTIDWYDGHAPKRRAAKRPKTVSVSRNGSRGVNGRVKSKRALAGSRR